MKFYLLSDGILNNEKNCIENTCFDYTKTFPYAFIKGGMDAIELDAGEYALGCFCLERRSEYELFVYMQSLNIPMESCEHMLNMGILTVSDSEKNMMQQSAARHVIGKKIPSFPGIRHFARTVVWNITSRCSLRCKHCILRNMDHGIDLEITEALVDRLFAEMELHGTERIQLSGGEPTLLPILPYMISASEKYHFSLDIFTNAFQIPGAVYEAAEKVLTQKAGGVTFHISVDGDREEHNLIRQHPQAFDNVLRSMELLNAIGAEINIETVVTRFNAPKMEALIQTAIEYKVHTLYAHPVFVFGDNNNPELALKKEEHLALHSSFRKLTKKYADSIRISYVDPYFPVNGFMIQQMLGDSCFRLRTKKEEKALNCVAGIEKLFIDCMGETYPCLLYANSLEDACGNITEHTLSEIWQSEGMRRVRTPFYSCTLDGCSKCKFNFVCSGKIKSCRRGAELDNGTYYASFDACNLADTIS